MIVSDDNDEEESSSGSDSSFNKYYPSLQKVINALEEFYGTKEELKQFIKGITIF